MVLKKFLKMISVVLVTLVLGWIGKDIYYVVDLYNYGVVATAKVVYVPGYKYEIKSTRVQINGYEKRLACGLLEMYRYEEGDKLDVLWKREGSTAMAVDAAIPVIVSRVLLILILIVAIIKSNL